MTKGNFKKVIEKQLRGLKQQVFEAMQANKGKLALIRVDTSFGKGFVTTGWKQFKETSDGMGFGLRRFKLTDKKYMQQKLDQLTNDMVKAYSVYILNGSADFGFINSLSLEIS